MIPPIKKRKKSSGFMYGVCHSANYKWEIASLRVSESSSYIQKWLLGGFSILWIDLSQMSPINFFFDFFSISLSIRGLHLIISIVNQNNWLCFFPLGNRVGDHDWHLCRAPLTFTYSDIVSWYSILIQNILRCSYTGSGWWRWKK